MIYIMYSAISRSTGLGEVVLVALALDEDKVVDKDAFPLPPDILSVLLEPFNIATSCSSSLSTLACLLGLLFMSQSAFEHRISLILVIALDFFSFDN